jgi:hypothetical protein
LGFLLAAEYRAKIILSCKTPRITFRFSPAYATRVFRVVREKKSLPWPSQWWLANAIVPWKVSLLYGTELRIGHGATV